MKRLLKLILSPENFKPEFEGVLEGIKGQYLYFNEGDFINVRSHEGYVIELDIQ